MSLNYFPFQLLITIFLLFAFSRVLLRFREGKIGLGALIFWSAVWILASIGVLNPEYTTLIARKLGIGRGADAIIYIALLLVFYLVYRTNVQIENLRHEITELTRKVALQQSGRNKKRK